MHPIVRAHRAQLIQNVIEIIRQVDIFSIKKGLNLIQIDSKWNVLAANNEYKKVKEK